MKFGTEKIVVVEDTVGTNQGLLSHVGDAFALDIRNVNFERFGGVEAKSFSYVDLTVSDIETRCYRISAREITEPVLLPLLVGAKKWVFIVNTDFEGSQTALHTLLIKRLSVHEAPHAVFIYFAPASRARALALHAQLISLKVNALTPQEYHGDYRALWNTVLKSGYAAPAQSKSNVITKEIAATASQKSLAPQPQKQGAAPPRPTEAPASQPVSKTLLNPLGDSQMASISDSLATLMSIDGAMGCFIADYSSGMVLAKAGGGVNLDLAAAGNTEVIKAKMKTMAALGIRETIEDILITLGTQYHIIRPLSTKQGLFLYLVLDKSKSNLAMARFKLQDAEKAMVV